jgi:hypothetical protein
MSETQQPETCPPEEVRPPITPPTPWPLRATHRRPAVVVLIGLLIVLQLVLAGIVVVHVQRLLNLEEHIEQLEKGQTPGPE